MLPEPAAPEGDGARATDARARLFAAFESKEALALALKRSGEALRLRAPAEGGGGGPAPEPAGADAPPMRVRACAGDAERARVLRFGVPLASARHDSLAGALQAALAPLPRALRAALAPLLASLETLGDDDGPGRAPGSGAALAGGEATAPALEALGAKFAARREQLGALSAAVARLELGGAGDGYDAWPGLAAAAGGARAATANEREAAADACALLVEARAALRDELEALRAVRGPLPSFRAPDRSTRSYPRTRRA